MLQLYLLSLQLAPIRLNTAVRLSHTSKSSLTNSLFDCDINLTHELLRDGIEELLLTASKKAYLVAGIVPGSNEKDSLEALELCSRQDLEKKTGVRLFSTFGVHPYNAKGSSVPESFITKCKQVLSTERAVVGVGECGLDGSPGFPPLEEQLVWFACQLDIACELNKPLFLHERNAHASFMKALEERKNRLPKKLLVHCFTGSSDELNWYLDFGCYISISGLICRADKEGKRFRDVIRSVSPPANRLLIETDAPYMQFPTCRKLEPSEAWKNSPNPPSAIIQVAQAVSSTLNRDFDQVCSDSFEAAKAFFNVDL